MQEWVGKRAKIFVRNLSDKPIVYTGKILSFTNPFITISARGYSHDTYSQNNQNQIDVSINIQDIVQIK